MITPSYGLTATEGVLPKFTLDWTTGLVQSAVDVARAGVATFVGSNGLIQSASADTQRIDYSTGVPGLLIEESRTNLCLYSEDMANAYWRGIQVGVALAPVLTADAGTAPDGTATADQLVFDLNGGVTSSDVSQWESSNIAFTSGVIQILSVWIKTTDNSTKTLTLVTPSGAGAFITATGQWTRVTSIHTPASTSSARARLRLRGSEPTSTTASILVWGWQVENGAFATSYIPTTTTAVTRNADVATITGTNFSDWFNSSKGTFRAEFTSIASGNRPVFAVDDDTANETMIVKTQGNVPTFEIIDGGSPQASVVAGTVTANTAAFAYVSYDADFFGIARPTARQVDTSGTVPTVDRMRIGSDQAGNFFNSQIQKIQFWP